MPRELDPAEGNWIWSESESDLLQTRTGHDLYEAASEAFAAMYANDLCVIPQSWRGTPTRYASNGVRWKWCYATIRDGRGWAPSIHHHRTLSPIHLLSLYMSFLLYTHSSFMHGNQKTLIFGFHLRGKFLPMFLPVFNNVSSYIFNFFS